MRFIVAAELLGQICIRWAWIENTVDELIAELAFLDADTGRAITNNVEIRTKIKILKALAHLKRPSDEWYEFLVSTLDYIDNILRVYRNNYVHASWFTPNKKLILRIREVRVKKAKAFQPSTISTEQELPIRIREMRRLQKELLGAVRDIITAYSYVRRREPEDEWPPMSFEQFLRWSPLRRPERERIKRLPPLGRL